MHRLVIMDTNTKNNKGKKSSLLMCFKPVVAKDKSLKPKIRKDKTTNQVASYIRVEERDGVVLPELSSAFAVADNGGGRRRRENTKDRRQALKAALNQTSLKKKINSKSKAGKGHLSRSNRSLENGNDMTNQKQYGVQCKISNSQSYSTHRSNSNISSSYGDSSAFTASPSLSSSSSSHSDQSSGSLDSSNENGMEVTNQKQYGVEDKKRTKACYGSYTSMCMFFISLLVLIMWGKFFATLYTTIWFYVMPPHQTRPCNKRDLSGDQSQFDSVQYKKGKSFPRISLSIK